MQRLPLWHPDAGVLRRAGPWIGWALVAFTAAAAGCAAGHTTVAMRHPTPAIHQPAYSHLRPAPGDTPYANLTADADPIAAVPAR